MNITKVVWLRRADMISETTAESYAGNGCRKQGFHGTNVLRSGEDDVLGVPEVSEIALVLAGTGEGSGAVVFSGAMDAGGGSETSVSCTGSGASLFGALGLAEAVPATCVSRVFTFFFTPATGAIAG